MSAAPPSRYPASRPFFPIGAHTANAALSGVVTLTPPEGADRVYVQALAQNVRFTLGGTTPTATLGFVLGAGDPPAEIGISVGTVLKVIEESEGAEIQYQWGV